MPSIVLVSAVVCCLATSVPDVDKGGNGKM